MATDAAVQTVRSFNRAVGRSLGAMDERFLGRDRPMGEARVLWEIGPDGAELRALRARLGLDSGYLSRLVRALEADGLVTTAPGEDDRRIRRAGLTRAGRAERAVLDERSDELARAVLEPLGERGRAELVEAMERVERLLAAGSVVLRDVSPTHPDNLRCLADYRAELARRTGRDPSTSLPVPDAAVAPPEGRTLVAYREGRPIGCGALKGGEVPEIKRLWVSAEARGLGPGPAPDGQPRGDRPRARGDEGAPGHEHGPDGGDRAVRAPGLRGGRPLQRRADVG